MSDMIDAGHSPYALGYGHGMQAALEVVELHMKEHRHLFGLRAEITRAIIAQRCAAERVLAEAR